MAVVLDKLVEPAYSDYRKVRPHSTVAVGVGLVGLMIAMGVLAISISAADDLNSGGLDTAELLALGFGFQTLALVTLKFGIGIALVGILVRLVHRIDSVNASLGVLRPAEHGSGPAVGALKTPYGAAKVTNTPPEPLPIHKMARALWFPMLVMGPMLVITGVVISMVWSNNIGTDTGFTAAAWTQGIQFLGEGFVLVGISFLLGSILGALREGGGKVQDSLGLTVTTLKMPGTAKAFVMLMMAGLMVSMVQFGLYIYVASIGAASAAIWLAWLGPLREIGLGLLLLGIVLALATIANVLGFQFSRLRSIVATGE